MTKGGWVLSLIYASALAYYAAIMQAPSFAYTLSETCGWARKPWAQALEFPVEPKRADQDAVHACWRRRGLKSLSWSVYQLHASWPSKAQLRAWEQADADTLR